MDMISRLKKNNERKIIASSISNDFDSFVLNSGDIIGFGCRIVNNKPWYQVYQEGIFNVSSYYDGPDYDKALRTYKDLMTAFNGVNSTEYFSKSESKIKDIIESSFSNSVNSLFTSFWNPTNISLSLALGKAT